MGRSVGVHHFGIQDNLTPIILLSVIALPAIFLMATSIPRHHEHHAEQSKRKSERENGKKEHLPFFAFLILGVIVLLRGLGQQGSVAFVPVLFEQKGWDPAAYGTITSSYWIASAVSGLGFRPAGRSL